MELQETQKQENAQLLEAQEEMAKWKAAFNVKAKEHSEIIIKYKQMLDLYNDLLEKVMDKI